MEKRSLLSKEQQEAMFAIRSGGDVFSPTIARRLRALHKAHPTLIEITEPMGRYTATQERPYLGAILTAAGRHALAASIRESA